MTLSDNRNQFDIRQNFGDRVSNKTTSPSDPIPKPKAESLIFRQQPLLLSFANNPCRWGRDFIFYVQPIICKDRLGLYSLVVQHRYTQSDRETDLNMKTLGKNKIREKKEKEAASGYIETRFETSTKTNNHGEEKLYQKIQAEATAFF